MTQKTLTQCRKTDPNDQGVLNKQTNKQSFLKRTRGKIERANFNNQSQLALKTTVGKRNKRQKELKDRETQ